MVTSNPYGISRAVRPWDTPRPKDEAPRKKEFVHTCDPEDVCQICRTCTATDCKYGICNKIRQALGPRRTSDKVRGLIEQGLGTADIAARLNLNPSTIRYHEKKIREENQDPCLKCYSKSVCEAGNRICNAKARWRR